MQLSTRYEVSEKRNRNDGDKLLKPLRKNKADKLSQLSTEQANPAARNLDQRSSLEIVRIINAEDAKVAEAVKSALPQIARGVDLIANALKKGGRLIYVGAGTSGRLAALDASECPPTFNTNPKTVQFVIAGGNKALHSATEASEDSRELGRREIAKRKPGKNDVVVGIAASGRTPFTIAAIEYARRHGAKTIAVTCNPASPLEKAAHVAIVAPVGPEVIAGSSRMKAGSAQKMILNMLSSGAMTRLGYVYGNLMVNVHVKNHKLHERGLTILQGAAGVSRNAAEQALTAARNNTPVALVMLQTNVTCEQATRALKSTGGHVRQAIAAARSL
jgi:N-acetylmuramic acid 6-phosphate etherase